MVSVYRVGLFVKPFKYFLPLFTEPHLHLPFMAQLALKTLQHFRFQSSQLSKQACGGSSQNPSPKILIDEFAAISVDYIYERRDLTPCCCRR